MARVTYGLAVLVFFGENTSRFWNSQKLEKLWENVLTKKIVRDKTAIFQIFKIECTNLTYHPGNVTCCCENARYGKSAQRTHL